MAVPTRRHYVKRRVPGETVGMYGDSQGIAGLEFPAFADDHAS